MSTSDRRTLLAAAATAMAWPFLAALPARAAAAGPNFAPPASPMLYTRSLVRELPGEASFVVERRFSIRFVPTGNGFQVSGEQVGVDVTAPAALARFVKIEKERREVGLFPIELDVQGRIFGSNKQRDEDMLDIVVQEVSAQLAQFDFSDGERTELAAYVRAVHQTASGLVTELPADLFAPADNNRSLSRELALPGGGSGLIQSRFHASTDPDTGLMREALREVVSDLGGDRRRITESWKLAPLA